MAFKLENEIFYIDDNGYATDKAWNKAIDYGNHKFYIVGCHIKVTNDMNLSFVWGSGTYSSNRHTGILGAGPFMEEPEKVECAAWDKDGNWFKWANDEQIRPYVTTNEAKIIVEHFMNGLSDPFILEAELYLAKINEEGD